MYKEVGVWKENQLIGQICCHSKQFCVADWASRRVDKPGVMTSSVVLYGDVYRPEVLPTGQLYHGVAGGS